MRRAIKPGLPDRLVFGSVQLGIPYGIANRTGQPGADAAKRLVRRALQSGISTFDTARAYGESEQRLGEAIAGEPGVTTITKLSPLAELSPDAPREDARAAVDRSIRESMKNLRAERLPCVLLHRAEHRTLFGGAVWERLLELKAEGRIRALGVSVQSPEEARDALDVGDIEHIQLPFNLLDWRWQAAHVPEKARARGRVTIHARSIFLQGLLAAGDPSIWPVIVRVEPRRVVNWLADMTREMNRAGVADLCLAYARGQDWIDGVVVGMETEDQLEANVALAVRPPLTRGQCAEIDRMRPFVPETLLNPALWPKR